MHRAPALRAGAPAPPAASSHTCRSHALARSESRPAHNRPAVSRRLLPIRPAGSASGSQPLEQLQEKKDALQQEGEDRVEEALQKVEDNMDAQIADALQDMVGRHRFDEKEQETFSYLALQMRKCALGLIVLAGVVVLNVVKQVWEGHPQPVPGISLHGVAVSTLSDALNACLLAALMWASAVSFRKTVGSEDAQLAYAFQGIIQLSIVFMQIAPITLGFAVVNVVEAAVRWPEIAAVVATAVTLTTLARAASLTMLLSKYLPGGRAANEVVVALRDGWRGLMRFPLFPDRTALLVSAGLLLPFSAPEVATRAVKADSPESAVSGGREDPHTDAPPPEEAEESSEELGSEPGSSGEEQGREQHEFSPWEERVLEVMMDAMRMAALALALQAMSSALLGVAVCVAEGPWAGHSYFTNGVVDQSVRAALLFSSAGCFRNVSDSEGRDVKHLLEGLSRKHGLGQLFRRMQKLAWGMASFKALSIALSLLTATLAWQRAQHQAARWVALHVPWGGAALSLLGLY